MHERDCFQNLDPIDIVPSDIKNKRQVPCQPKVEATHYNNITRNETPCRFMWLRVLGVVAFFCFSQI